MTTTDTRLPVFPSFPQCKRCELHQGAKNPGVPTRPLATSGLSSSKPPLIVVGMNPGVREDALNQCFTGPSGQLLTSVYLNHDALLRHPIYLTNAARCPTLGNNEKPKRRHYNTCWQYTQDDILAILALHSPQIAYVLCLGADAYHSVSRYYLGKGMSLRHGFNNQGQPNTFGPVDRLRIYATFHPAAVLREQKYLHPVSDHMELLVRAMSGDLPTPSNPKLVEPTWPPAHSPTSLFEKSSSTT